MSPQGHPRCWGAVSLPHILNARLEHADVHDDDESPPEQSPSFSRSGGVLRRARPQAPWTTLDRAELSRSQALCRGDGVAPDVENTAPHNHYLVNGHQVNSKRVTQTQATGGVSGTFYLL